MNLSEAQEIIRTLANGIDPTTGEVLSQQSPFNNPGVIRALFTVHDSSRRAPRIAKTIEERQKENIGKGRPENFGLPWTAGARDEVSAGFRAGKTFGELATTLGRSPTAIRLELVNQGLVEPDSPP